MAEISVKNLNNDKIRDIQIPDEIFAYPLKKHLIYEAIKNYRANARSGTASTKNRVDVRGGGRKPWRQKGTGRARVGSIRSPLWRGGGIVFGPKPRDYSYDLPKKMRKNALKSILSAKFSDGKIVVLDDIKIGSSKTKDFVKLMKGTLGIKGKALLVYDGGDENLELSSRNYPLIKVVRPLEINPYDLLDREWLIFSEKALQRISEVFGK